MDRFSPDCAGCRRKDARFLRAKTAARSWRPLLMGIGALAALFLALSLEWMVRIRPARNQVNEAQIVTPAPMVISPPVLVAPAPVAPPAPVSVPDPIHDGWRGSFLFHTRASSASIVVNGSMVFLTHRAGTFITAPITLRLNDVVVFEIDAPSAVMRAAFMTADGKQEIALRAADLRDLGSATTINCSDFDSLKDSPVAVGKVSQTEVNAWEKSGAHPVPHGSEFVQKPGAQTYRVGFVVTAAIFRPMKTPTLSQRKVFHFDDVAYAKRYWRWKANFSMDANGASDPAEPDNELVSRFMLEGDFTVDMDASFGQAAYTNTGGMNVTVCRQEIGFDGGWNFGSWNPCQIHMRVQRLGDEIQLIRDGQVLIVAVPDEQRDQPTPWRLWWRSRSCNLHSIFVSAERITMEE